MDILVHQWECLFLHRRRFLYVINLDAPSEVPKKIARQSKWDIGAVQWNPHETSSHYFAASVSKMLHLALWKWKNECGL